MPTQQLGGRDLGACPALPSPGTSLLQVSLADRLRCFLIERLLRKRARASRAAGLPALACFPLDSIGREIVSDGFYERELLSALFDVVFADWRQRFAGSVAIDVGANIGNHSCYFAPRFARVHAFEVNPTAAHLLEANVAFNRYRNVRVHSFGLSDTPGTLPFEEFQGGNLGRSRFLDENAQGTEAAAVRQLPVEVFDRIEADLALDLPVGLVKIDVEGFERRVIAGMAGMLSREQPFVLFESQAGAGPDGGEAIFSLLRSLGYRRFLGIERAGSWQGTSRASLLDAVGGRRWRLVQLEASDDQFHQLILASPF